MLPSGSENHLETAIKDQTKCQIEKYLTPHERLRYFILLMVNKGTELRYTGLKKLN